MSSDTEVRQWARANGVDVNAKGPVATHVRAEYEAAHPVSEQDDGDSDVVITIPSPLEAVPDLPPETPPAGGSSTRRPEVPPKGKKVTAAEKFRARLSTRPKTKHKRLSIEDTVSGIWGILGAAMTRAEPFAPMGRMLMVQAPVAGFIAEDSAKNTAIDKFLQPIARAGEQGKVAAALVGPPVLVGLLSLRPELAPVGQPILETVLDYWFDLAIPATEKIEKIQRDKIEKRGGVDTHALVEWIFTGESPVPSEDEEAAIRRAQGL